MKALQDINKRISIKTKSVLYVMVLILVIYVSVSVVVLSSSRRNLNIQRQKFHQSIAEKLAINASDAIISENYGFLMEQIRQLKSSGQVKSVNIIDRNGIIIASDNLKNLGQLNNHVLRELDDFTNIKQTENPSIDRIFLPVEIEGDILGALEVYFDLQTENAGLDKEFRKTIIQLLYLSLFIFAVGIGGSFIVSFILTKPVTNLLREIEAFERGIGVGHVKLYDSSDRDEIVQLRNAFYHMIGDIKKYLSEFRKMSEEREKLSCMASIGQMSAQIAHEIRNSLYAIRGAISGIERANEFSEIQEYVRVIKDETTEMTIMADEFLRFSKMPSPTFVPVDMDDVIDRVIDILEPDLEDSRVKVIKKIRGKIPKIMGDPSLLKQMFINLFINAIQAMRVDGIITVDYTVSDEQLEVHVMDTGPGIPPEMSQKIFQPFFTTKTDGTGLGLATVYKIILAHHGDIKLIPSESGAHFVIKFKVGDRHIDADNLKLDYLGVGGEDKQAT